MEALHKDGGDGYHRKIGGKMMEFTVETTMTLNAIVFTI
jgi:hypothetical protein